MLNDRVTLVTGGGTVIGKAIGVQLSKNGSKVALAFRDPGQLKRRSVKDKQSSWRSITIPNTANIRLPGQAPHLHPSSEQFKAKVSASPIRRFLGPDELQTWSAISLQNKEGYQMSDICAEDNGEDT